jgi:hypothetical protein
LLHLYHPQRCGREWCTPRALGSCPEGKLDAL